MRTPSAWARLLAALFLLAATSLHAAPIPKLAGPPLGERWFSILMGDERVGFAHQVIKPVEGGFQIDSEGSVKLKVMGFSREATTKESYLVAPDLTLRSFATEERLDGSPMSLRGEMTPKGVKVTVQSASGKKERTLKTKGAVYPPQALNFYPLIQGAVPGKKYRVSILDSEAVKVKEVKVEVVKQESFGSGIPALHLKNNLFPMVDNDIWVDLKGNTLKESVRDDLVVTLAEDEITVKNYLADAALAKSDLVYDFSLIKVAPIDRPDELKELVVDFSGIPEALPLLESAQQQGARLPDGTVRFTLVPQIASKGRAASTPADLEPTARIPSDHQEIVAKKSEILGEQKEPRQMVVALAAWVAKEIKGSVTDSQSPLETLKHKTGNCQSHSRLYAALARAAGIPTRFVSGVMYAKGKGFLYHSWAESLIDGVWLPLDPTFGQIPADLTHIKLVEGDTPDDLAQLAGVIGKVKAQIVKQDYQ